MPRSRRWPAPRARARSFPRPGGSAVRRAHHAPRRVVVPSVSTGWSLPAARLPERYSADHRLVLIHVPRHRRHRLRPPMTVRSRSTRFRETFAMPPGNPIHEEATVEAQHAQRRLGHLAAGDVVDRGRRPLRRSARGARVLMSSVRGSITASRPFRHVARACRSRRTPPRSPHAEERATSIAASNRRLRRHR